MTRSLFALLLTAALVGCGEEKQPVGRPGAPAPDASIFDKKDVPKGGKKAGAQGS